MKTIHLARGLTLPAAELATEVVASLGQRGSGKSNGAGVIAEGLLAAGVQVIVLDHVGIWFSLRLAGEGKHPSPYLIPVLGGQHGDITLVATTGAVVAEALARSGSSAVLDVSAFSKGDRCRFAADFAEAFFAAKKLHPGPVQILLEEAQRYVPQKLFAGQGLERMLGAFEEIAEVGRNYGVGLHLISQRPQKINKDVLNLADTVLAYRSNGVLERKAISDWVQEKGAEGRKEMHDELPGLACGTAIVWSPNRKIYGPYAIQKKSTYDAGATPTHARAAVKTKRLDLDSLESAMGAAVEEAKANDPRALKARVAELERELAKKPTTLVAVAPAKTIEKSVLKEADIKRLERLAEKLGKNEKHFKEIVIATFDQQRDKLSQAQQAMLSELQNFRTVVGDVLYEQNRAPRSTSMTKVFEHNYGPSNPKPMHPQNAAPRPRAIRAEAPGRREADGHRSVHNDPLEARYRGNDDRDAGTSPMPEKCQKMLGALSQGEAMGLSSMPFRNVAVIAGVAPDSGTTGNRKGFLKNNGYITVHGDHVQLTEKGRTYPLSVELPPTDRMALLDFWKRQIKTEKIVAMLDFVVRNKGATDDQLAEAAVMAKSGTFGNYKGALVGRGLMVKVSNGVYAPAEAFGR